MKTALELLSFFAVVIYGLLLTVAFLAFFFRRKKQSGKPARTSVTVVVAMRNEEQNIVQLLESITHQVGDIPFDVVLVDDHSTDQSVSVAQRYSEGASISIRVFESPGEGKKAAITEGVHQSDCEIILVTDADCVVGSQWIRSHMSNFENPRVQFSAGMVTYSKTDSLIRDVVQTEMVFLQVVSAGLYVMQNPLMCNGASMGFRRQFFLETKGFVNDRFVSGDDIFLLQKALDDDRGSVAWNYEKSGLVQTKAPRTFIESVVQRKRWLSKISGYSDWRMYLTGPLFLAAQLLMPAAIISVFVYDGILNPVSAAFMIKSLIELLLLSLAVPFFGETGLLLKFPIAVVVYDLISLNAVIGLFQRNMIWKDRSWRMGKLK